MIEVEAQENHEWLLDHFVQYLLSHGPESVLDVGCGQGKLMRRVGDRGIPVTGIDQAGERLDTVIEEGLNAREGSAYELPFENRSIDWISMRHVPHHLEDPARAFAEAIRVARSGILIAEPFFDRTLPSQEAALHLDRWEKRQHRRRGMFHADDIELGPLLALMPDDLDASFHVEVVRHLRLRGRSVELFANEAQALLDDLPETHAERVALHELLERLQEVGLSWNGSLCVALHRTQAAASQ